MTGRSDGSIVTASSPISSMLCVFRNGRAWSVRNPLIAFSAACWQWNTAASLNGGSAALATSAARASSEALRSQERVSTKTAGSLAKEDPPFTNDRCGQGGDHAESLLERPACPDQHVCGDASAAEDLVGQAGAPALGRRVVRHDEEDVVIAVRPGLATRSRAEEVHALRLVGGNKPTEQLRQRRIAHPVRDLGHEIILPARVKNGSPPHEARMVESPHFRELDHLAQLRPLDAPRLRGIAGQSWARWSSSRKWGDSTTSP